MKSTSESLLIRLKSANDFQAWSQFVELYTPMLFYWARKTGLSTEDASDLVQEVLTLVSQRVSSFEYEPSKSFRGWLRTVTLNKFKEHMRRKSLPVVEASASALMRVIDPKAVDASRAQSVWDLQYQPALVTRALELVREEFLPKTWQALREYVISERPATEIASETGVSVWTIYAAKSRLLARLRAQLDGLLE